MAPQSHNDFKEGKKYAFFAENDTVIVRWISAVYDLYHSKRTLCNIYFWSVSCFAGLKKNLRVFETCQNESEPDTILIDNHIVTVY